MEKWPSQTEYLTENDLSLQNVIGEVLGELSYPLQETVASTAPDPHCNKIGSNILVNAVD